MEMCPYYVALKKKYYICSKLSQHVCVMKIAMRSMAARMPSWSGWDGTERQKRTTGEVECRRILM